MPHLSQISSHILADWAAQKLFPAEQSECIEYSLVQDGTMVFAG